MRATEFTNRQQPILEGKHQVQLGDLVLDYRIDGANVDVRAIVDDKQVGYVIFNRDGRTLFPDDLAVDAEYRGRGIAKKMYDWVKSLPQKFEIIRGDQTEMGKRFWDKNRGEHVDVWEEGMTEGVTESATVTRIDSKPITDFASNLNTYKHTDDWSQSGLDMGDDSYWSKRNIKPNTSKGLFAGDPHRTALYATGNANETRYVEYTENGQPVVYFDKKDLPAIRGRKTYLSVFDASDFRKLPSGEWFSEHPSKPIKQIPINDPFKYIESQGWKIRITNDLNKVLKKVQQLQKVGKIDHYGAEGMNESKQGVAEGRSKDFAERHYAAMEIEKILDNLLSSESPNVTPEIFKKIKELVAITGRSQDIRYFGSAGELLDQLDDMYRQSQIRSGQMPQFTGRASAARDMARQIANQTRGTYRYIKPETWTTRFGQRYRDPADYVVYPDQQSYDDALEWIENKGKKVRYRDNFGDLTDATQIGSYIIEPSTFTQDAFSDKPQTTHRISVRLAKTINQGGREQIDITDQQAAALQDIASTKSQNAIQSIQLILKVLQGEQDIKQIIDNSKKITPQDKAKLDAIITGAKNFQEPNQGVAEGLYREGGSITHDGVEYDFDSVMSIAEKIPTKTCSVDKLSWVLEYDTPNKERLERADITVPLIVTKSSNGKLAAIDGLHRLAKAVRDNVKTLPVKYVTPKMLSSAKIIKQGVAEDWSEKYKKSINCKNPKGFSQRAHCQGRKKNNEQVELDERKRKRKKKTARYYYGPAYYFGATDTGAEGGDGGGLEEDWKKSLANVGLAGAIGLGAAGGLELKDKIKSAFTKPTAQTTQQVQPKQSQSTAKKVQPQQVQVSPITNNPLETYLMNAAKKSGLTGIELAQFLGQCAHETMDYKRMIERGAKKYFNKYEPKFAPGKAKLLGNVKLGDGERYKGRGYIQLTGRYNYKTAGKALNLPLEQNPELAAQPDIAAQIALWYWGQRVKSEVQDFADTTSVTRKINPGLSGLADRHENFVSYLAQR